MFTKRILLGAGAGVMALAAVLGTALPAAAFNPTPEPPRLQLVDATWMGKTGLPDSFAHADQGLVVTVPASTPADSRIELANVTGVAGLPTSALGNLAFAVGDGLPSGIDPCWLVGYVDAAGDQRTVDVMPGSTDFVVVTDAGTSVSGQHFTEFTFTKLPAGTVTSVTLNAHVTAPLTGGATMVVDNLGVGGAIFTFAGDGSV